MIPKDEEIVRLLHDLGAQGVAMVEIVKGASYICLASLQGTTTADVVQSALGPATPEIVSVVFVGMTGVLRIRRGRAGATLPIGGSAIAPGDVLATITMGLLVRPLVAPRAGRFRRFLRQDGEIVGDGSPVLEMTIG